MGRAVRLLGRVEGGAVARRGGRLSVRAGAVDSRSAGAARHQLVRAGGSVIGQGRGRDRRGPARSMMHRTPTPTTPDDDTQRAMHLPRDAFDTLPPQSREEDGYQRPTPHEDRRLTPFCPGKREKKASVRRSGSIGALQRASPQRRYRADRSQRCGRGAPAGRQPTTPARTTAQAPRPPGASETANPAEPRRARQGSPARRGPF